MNARPARRRGKKLAARTRLSTSAARSFVIVAVIRVSTVRLSPPSIVRGVLGRTFLSLTQSHFSPLKTPRKTELHSYGLGSGGVPASVATREKGSCHYHHPQPRRMVSRSFEGKVWSSHELHCDPCEALLRNRSGVVYAKT